MTAPLPKRARDSGFPDAAGPSDDMATTGQTSSPGAYKVSLPFFTGQETAGLRADHFIHMVEQCGSINRWSHEAMTNAASLNLRDTARTWSQLYFQDYVDMTQWVEFKTAFLARFHRKTTLSDKQALINKLKQRSHETVDDFMERIQLTIMDMDSLFNAESAVYFFLQGVHPGLKKFLEQDKTLLVKKDFLESGRAYERAHPTQPAQSMINAAHDSDEEEDDPEMTSVVDEAVAALQRRRARPPFRPRGSGPNRRFTPGRRPTNYQPATTNRPPPGRCYRCNRFGHFRKDCKVPQSLIAALDEAVSETNAAIHTEDRPDDTEPAQETEPDVHESAYVLETENLNFDGML
ncbi:MAG: hypothetical protein KAG97_01120 [Victivallales bacterium]|nr:hypothetical protein [Victivallales bacterium]